MQAWETVTKLVGAVILAATLGACVEIMEIPKVHRLESVTIQDTAGLAAIKLGKVNFKIRRGTPIGAYRLTYSVCRFREDKIYWNQGRGAARNIEYSDLFFDAMDNANFNVIGDPGKLFEGQTKDTVQPNYLVGAVIEEVRSDVCDFVRWYDQLSLDTQSGKGYVKVKWQVFSNFDKRVVFETETEGAADVKEPATNGEMVILTEAFAEAAANLAANEKLVALLSKPPKTQLDIRAVNEVRLLIPLLESFNQPISENIDRIRFGAVTIETGLWHGSGFFISPRFVVTNYHVVENLKIVRVVLVTGRKILGEVIRRHSKRDVALIQVESGGHQPLPIRTKPLKIAEDVYAIGAPHKKQFSGTVTKGIVSKFRTNSRGLEDIQADVDILGGSSGGVLLDSEGNVVGVSYAGIGPPGQFSSGLNFFIPIYDALDKLNIELEPRKAASGS